MRTQIPILGFRGHCEPGHGRTSFDLLTVSGRFDCPTPGSRWLHPAMLTTLVYRFGPPGAQRRRPGDGERPVHGGAAPIVSRTRRDAAVRGEVVEDIALARRLANDGCSGRLSRRRELLEVRMFESLGDTWRGWGRSLAFPGVEPTSRQLFDLAVVLLAQALPLPRLLLRKATCRRRLLAASDRHAGGTRTAYSTSRRAYWLSPLPTCSDPDAADHRRGAPIWRRPPTAEALDILMARRSASDRSGCR